MKRVVVSLLAIGFCLGSARANESVQAVQSRLKEAGFYFGDSTGVYDSETAAAVTRYQIRHGLAISGRLDAATAKALGLPAANTAAAEPSPTSGTWRRLRNGDMQFLTQLNSDAIPPPKIAARPSPPKAVAGRVVASAVRKSQLDSHAPPPRLEEDVPAASPPSPAVQDVSASSNGVYGPERLRDYVGAFVLAGLDPKVGAELEFFGERVDYFGEHNVDRPKIQRDLMRYDKRWPQRRFWLAGELDVEPKAGGKLRVTFPLGYELRNASKHSLGKVMKTLTLRKTGNGELEIVGVNEKKLKG